MFNRLICFLVGHKFREEVWKEVGIRQVGTNGYTYQPKDLVAYNWLDRCPRCGSFFVSQVTKDNLSIKNAERNKTE